MRRIGYFIPEFPGQTHIFFWREHQGLLKRGIEPELVSTRRPPSRIVSHDWAQQAMAQTTYLFPPKVADVARAAKELIKANPMGWGRCLASIARSEGLDAKGRARLLALVGVGAELAELAHRRQWSHVHVHSCADAAHIAMFAHLLTGLPYSITLHGPLVDYGPNQKEKWRHAAFAVVITKRLVAEVHQQLGSSVPSVIELAPMGVELGRFKRTAAYQPWRGDGPLRLFSCGRLNPCKGHDDLVKAVGTLRQKGIDARLEIAGEDEAGGTTWHVTLQKLIDDLKLNDAVTLLGAVNESRVKQGIEQAHVFSLASLQEPLGVAIMEAMALEAPVVVTGAGGVPELVDDGQDGVLVPPQDPTRLAAGLEKVAKDAAMAQRLGAAARHKVETLFHADRSVDVLDKHLPHGA